MLQTVAGTMTTWAEFFGRLELAMIKRFPKLKLYDSWGIQAQSLEGSLEAGYQGTSIVCFGAVAVPQLSCWRQSV